MRILYHHRTMLEDAQGIHIQEMVRAFRAMGHEVKMVSLVKKGGKEQHGRKSSFKDVLKEISHNGNSVNINIPVGLLFHKLPAEDGIC